MTDDRKHPHNDDLPAPHDREAPVARPTQDEGDLYVFSETDCADIAADVFAFARELPTMSDDQAEETATMVFELLTGAWGEHADAESDHDSDYRITD